MEFLANHDVRRREPAFPTRVLIADAHPILRTRLRQVLQQAAHIEVVDEAGSPEQTIERAAQLVPHVILMDVVFGGRNAVSACRIIRERYPEIQTIMVASAVDEKLVISALLAGAAAYVMKESAPDRLLELIDTVAQGGSLLDQTSTNVVLGWVRREAAAAAGDPLAGLSWQERNILPLIAQRMINREIAAKLGLSETL